MKLNFKYRRGESVYFLPIEKIRPAEDAPRKSFDNYKLSELAESIRKCGVLQPLTVVAKGEEYILYSGLRRYKSALMLGLNTLPCYVYKETRTPKIIPMLESLTACPINMFEEAEGIATLLDNGLTILEIAEILGITPAGLEERLKILSFSAIQRSSILGAGLTRKHVKALIRLKDELQRAKALDYVVAKGLSPADCEKYVDSLLKPEKTPIYTGQSAAFYLDGRVLDNTFGRIETTLKNAGVTTEFRQNESESYREYIFRIPKTVADSKATK